MNKNLNNETVTITRESYDKFIESDRNYKKLLKDKGLTVLYEDLYKVDVYSKDEAVLVLSSLLDKKKKEFNQLYSKYFDKVYPSKKSWF